MIKDYDYYMSLDLFAVAIEIPTEREARLRSEAFGDLISAIICQCKSQSITVSQPQDLLGEPDRIRQWAGGGIIWEYDWIGTHGPNEYFSITPFVLQSDRVVGIEREGDVI